MKQLKIEILRPKFEFDFTVGHMGQIDGVVISDYHEDKDIYIHPLTSKESMALSKFFKELAKKL